MGKDAAASGQNQARSTSAGRRAVARPPRSPRPPRPPRPIDGELARAVLEGSAVPTLVLVANRLVFANRAARAVLGYEDTPPRDLLGRDAAGFIAPRDRAVTAKGVARLLTTGLPARNVPRLLVHRDGCEVLAICAASMIRWRGRPALVVGFMVLSGVPELGAEPDGMPHLSPRERQVARLVARGVRTGEIARTLGLRESTVRAHLKAVYRKADCHSRVELTQLVLGLQRQP